MGDIEADLPDLRKRAGMRSVPDAAEALRTRTWEALGSSLGDDPTLWQDLRAAIGHEPRATLCNALGVVAGLDLDRAGRPAATAALEQFQNALECDPADVLAGLNAAEALGVLGRSEEAISQARRALATLERADDGRPDFFDGGHFPPRFDLFRVEWERAAWANAGQPVAEAAAKRDLLRWRLHGMLAEWTGDLEHYRKAEQVRPDLGPSAAALGCALGRAGRPAEAVVPLRRALAANPFDAAAARALYHALGEAGDHDGQQELARQRRDLASAAPLLAREPWFEAGPVQPTADWLETLSPEAFRHRYGALDTSRALCGYTNAADTNAVLTLLAHARPRRLLEVGTALGHMTANFTEWTADDAVVFTLGTTADLPVPTAAPQRYETPERRTFGLLSNAFGKAAKVLFITADSLAYDFGRLAPLDFIFIDGAHDRQHVLADTVQAYAALRPGGLLVWHDFTSPAAWVEVRATLEWLRFREPVVHVAGTAVAFLRKAESLPPAESSRLAPRVGTPHSRSECSTLEDAPLCIVWEGAQQAAHSFGVVNRELCAGLLARGHAVSLLATAPLDHAERAPDGTPPPAGYHVLDGDDVPLPVDLAACFYRALPRPADAHIRHQWPPDLLPPPEGHWVWMQPWEYGSIPRDWLPPLLHEVDEVWAYTRYVRDCYLAAGVPADRVHIVPCGVACDRFRPDVLPLQLPTRKRFKFLFVGGTIHRKGIDVLLDAYARAFTAADDVCLVVKDFGARSFYQGQTAGRLIEGYRREPGNPEILYLDGTLAEGELPGLYAACDCLAHPYRGEGFGLPIAEAMACGLPVVVTGLGAALDFCDDANAYLIPAKPVEFTEQRVGGLATVGRPWLAEPDGDTLARLLRHVYEHADEARAKGRAGCRRIREHFTWAHAAAAAERRLRALRNQPVRRSQPRTVIAAVPGGRPTVSLCMIVRNEEANLPACLASVADLVDEVIVVDTGSTDRTKEVAAGFGAKVFDFAWVDSFAAARNESLRHAGGDWVFWLDADDRLDEENRQKLKALFAGLTDENAAYVFKCLCLPDPEGRTATLVDHVRLFRNHPALRWQYRVHEQILPALRHAGADVRWADVVIEHTGYQDVALRRRKLDRDRRLLELEAAEHPDDPFVLFNQGCIAQEVGDLAAAVPLLRRSLTLCPPGASIVRKLYALLAQCHRKLGQHTRALAACREGRSHYPDDVELLFQEGVLRREAGDRTGARACWERALASRPGEHFASVDTGLSGYKARHNLAQLDLEDGDLAAAEAQWRAALAQEPGFVPARLGLAEVCLRQGRWHDLEYLAAELAAAGDAVEADVLRARGHLARGESADAFRLLEAAIARSPQALLPRRLLGHALLQAGGDPAAAEWALRQLLALAPDDAEARHNLDLLRQRHGHVGEAG